MKPEIDDIVAYLDNFMGQGGGHVSVKVNEQAEIKSVKSFSCDCTENSACKAPTLFEGLDEENL